MRQAFLLLLITALIALGCRPSEPTRPADGEVRDDLFRRLTAGTWCTHDTNNDHFADTTRRYKLLADGTYDWTQNSDVNEGEGVGDWNFTVTDRNSGVVFLQEGDALRFEFTTDGRIVLDFDLMEACGPLTAKGKVQDLRPVPGSPLFQKLTAHTWYRTGNINLYRQATSLTFQPDGRFVAEYEDGKCTESGDWSLHESSVTRQIEGTPCDFRIVNRTDLLRYRTDAAILGQELLLAQDFYTPQAPSGSSGAILVSRRPVHELRIEIPRRFLTGQAAQLTFELENTGRFPLTLQSVTVAGTPRARTTESFTATGPKEVLGTAELGEIVVEPGRKQRFAVDLTPAVAGEVNFDVEVQIQGNRKAENAETSFLAEVSAP